MATTKRKTATKKPAKMAKAKALQPVKPLTEAITFNYGKIGIKYGQQ